MPGAAADDQKAIDWALSFFRSGRASQFANRIRNWESKPANSHRTYFIDWVDFVDTFRCEFAPLHVDSAAINKLESTSYFQRARTVEDYIDEFIDLISDSGYTDGRTIVVKFRRGLRPEIQDAVATMASGRPSDIDFEAWYRVARQFDQNRMANEAFRQSHRPPLSNSQPRIPAPPAFRSTGHPSRAISQPTPSFAHLTPAPGNPVPMDIGAAPKKAPLPAACFRCGNPGHIKANCPIRIDVRQLTAFAREELIEELNALKDAEEASYREVSLEEDEEVPATSDFRTRNE